jgi:hypothetical protein
LAPDGFVTRHLHDNLHQPQLSTFCQHRRAKPFCRLLTPITIKLVQGRAWPS